MSVGPDEQRDDLAATLSAYEPAAASVDRLRRPHPTGLIARLGLGAALSPYLPLRPFDPRAVASPARVPAVLQPRSAA